MKTPLRYIMIGTGGYGYFWCKNFLPRLAELGKAIPVAAVDISPKSLENARDFLKLPSDKCYSDMAKAFAENEADFVIIVVPPAHHEAVVDMALTHNLHILSEKPISDSMEGACRIYQKVRAKGKKMAVTMSHRFDQDKQSLERLIHSADYGRMDYLVGRNTWNQRTFPVWGAFRYKIADPLLIEWGVHALEVIRALTRSNAKTVYARTWNPAWSDFAGDAQGLFLLEMENGVKVFYEAARCAAAQLNGSGQDYWKAECELGTLELNHRRLRVTSDLSGEHQIIEKPLIRGDIWMNSLLAEWFCDWLLGERAEHPTAIEDNLQCTALLFATIKSAHTGQPVDVRSFLESHLPNLASTA